MIFYFYISLLFFDLVVLVQLVISLLLFISCFFAFLIRLPVLDFLCSCGALSCLCVIEFLSWLCSWFTLPGLAAYSAAILLVDVQAIPVVFPSCLSVYSVLVVKSHANITTLLYLCFVINHWHSLTLQLGPPSRSLTYIYIYIYIYIYNLHILYLSSFRGNISHFCLVCFYCSRKSNF